MKVTRTIEVNDLTPEELAALFADLNGYGQAKFFAEVWKIAKDWPGTGWCQQSRDIVAEAGKLDSTDATNALETLADHANEGSEWKSLAMRVISMFEDVERETSWGQPTFGPTVWEELSAAQDKLLAKVTAA